MNTRPDRVGAPVPEEELATDAAIHADSPGAPAVSLADRVTVRSQRPAGRALRESAPSPPPGPGTVLGGRFRLEELVGKGGTGEVYRARDLLVEKIDASRATVAVKLLAPALGRDPALLRAILKSALAMRELQHPNIAQVFELQRFGAGYGIVMEWLEGESLARRIDRVGHPALSRREFAAMVKGVGAALDFAHAAGVVHGDIKPANVFLTSDERVKVLDFGFAGALEPDGLAGPAAPLRGVTGAYASCEVLQGSAPTAQDDVYGMAALIYRMLAGCSPHGRRDAAEAASAGARPARPAGLTSRQWRTLQRGLAPRRAKRLQHVAPLVEAFWAPPARRRSKALVSTVFLLGIAAAGFAWLAATGRLPLDIPGLRGSEQLSVPREEALLPAAPADARSDALADVPASNVTVTPATPAPLVEPADESVGTVDATGDSGEAADAAPAEATMPAADIPTAAEMAAPAAPAPAPQPAALDPLVVGFARGEDPVVGESDGVVKLRITSRGQWRTPVIVEVTTQDGAARLGEDFMAPLESRFVLSARQPSAEVLIPLISDTVAENVEDFAVRLTIMDGEATLGDDEVTVLILDDD